MSKFKKKTSKAVQGINTASLPDIVFMLLFFFMVTTVMREVTLKVMIRVPEATEIKKLEKKSLVSYVYIGQPQIALQRATSDCSSEVLWNGTQDTAERSVCFT